MKKLLLVLIIALSMFTCIGIVGCTNNPTPTTETVEPAENLSPSVESNEENTEDNNTITEDEGNIAEDKLEIEAVNIIIELSMYGIDVNDIDSKIEEEKILIEINNITEYTEDEMIEIIEMVMQEQEGYDYELSISDTLILTVKEKAE